MTLALRYAVRSDVGLLREGNEDSAYAGPHLLAVADGMGGHAAGEVASAAAITTLTSLDADQPPGDLLNALAHAVVNANMRLQEMILSDPATEGMGTTLTAMLWSEGHAALCHIGDSRAYLLRDGQLYQITHDHTLVQSLVDEGRITEDDVATHPQRSLLLRALDGRTLADPDLSVHETLVGDRYLLCSDGLSGVVTEQTLHHALSSTRDLEKVTLQLVELALKGGGPDNITCIVADVVDTQNSPIPPSRVPVLAGAASAGPPEQLRSAVRQNSPAGRAGLLRRTAPQQALRPDGDDDAAHWAGGTSGPATTTTSVDMLNGRDFRGIGQGEDGGGRHGHRARPRYDDDDEDDAGDDDYTPRSRRHRRKRWPVVTGVTVAAVLVIGGGLYGGYRYTQEQYFVGVDKGNIAIFRGVNQSLAGISLSSSYQRTSVPVSQLPASNQLMITQTVSSSSLADARQTVANIETTVAECEQQWQQAAAWQSAEVAYQAKLNAYNHTPAAQKQKEKLAKPTPPGAQPTEPGAAECAPASAFGIPASALPAGSATGAGAVANPTATPSTTPTAKPGSSASPTSRTSPAATTATMPTASPSVK